MLVRGTPQLDAGFIIPRLFPKPIIRTLVRSAYLPGIEPIPVVDKYSESLADLLSLNLRTDRCAKA